MAKFYGTCVKTGKVGGSVFRVRNGVTIESQYQPQVMNPKTEGQIETRAKLKLLSQVSAAVAPIVAIPRRGLVSPRNAFVKTNYEFVGYDGTMASIPLGDIVITDSVIGLPGFVANRTEGVGIKVALSESASTSWDAIMWVLITRTTTGQIMPYASTMQTDPGRNGFFEATLPYVAGEIGVLAYGIRYNSASALTSYGNYTVNAAMVVAQLIATRKLDSAEYVVSETRGLSMAQDVNSAATAGVASVMITVVIADTEGNQTPNAGTVSGGGVAVKGSTVTLVATPAEGYTFSYWWDTRTSTIIGQESTLSFVADEARRIGAIMTAE